MAAGREAEHDVVARAQHAGLGAGAFDDAHAFVAQDGGQGVGQVLVERDEVGVAHAGGDEAHEHFVGLGFVEIDGLDAELAGLAGDGGADLHGSWLSGSLGGMCVLDARKRWWWGPSSLWTDLGGADHLFMGWFDRLRFLSMQRSGRFSGQRGAAGWASGRPGFFVVGHAFGVTALRCSRRGGAAQLTARPSGAPFKQGQRVS